VYDIERYLTIRAAYGASLGPDGTLSFLLDTTGVPQVWTLEQPQGWPTQQTFADEPIAFASASPERPERIFGMDEGGNERQQLYRLDADGQILPLTDRPDAKHRWGGWSSDGERFAFASNARDESVFDVYVQHRDAVPSSPGTDPTAVADRVHEGDGWLSVAGWSPDDTRLAVVESHWSFDQDVYTLDVEAGELIHRTPHEDDVRFYSISWGPAGEALYCVTDYERDTLGLARLDVTADAVSSLDDALEFVMTDEQWNVDGIALDEESGRFVTSTNVDGYTELTVGEFTGPTEYETLPTPDLPGGLAGGVSWGPDADRFALSVTGRTINTNLFVVDAATGDVTRWTAASTAGIPRSTFVEPSVVRFESFDGREIPALFSLPEDTETGETPVIVDVHGGPESQRRPSFSGLIQYFLANGYAVFEPNVRGSTGYGTAYTHLDDVEKRMDSVRDLRAGAEWLHDHPAVDDDRIAIKGGSYGGFMCLAAMTEFPDLWSAGVDVVGIANFVTFLENTGEWRRSLREAEYGSLETDREFLESISPINNAAAIDAPLFVLHGANDPRVPVDEARQIAEAVESRGQPVELLVFEDEGHGISKLDNQIEAYGRIVDFLDEHV